MVPKLFLALMLTHFKEEDERNNNVQRYCTHLLMDWLIANVCRRAKSRGKE